MAWINLFIAGILEVVWAISLKYSNGLTIVIPTVITIIGMIASFYFLSLATKTLPIGTAYAVWTGFGAIGTVILGIILFGEQVSFARILFLLLIIIGIIGLKLS
ncbi:MAG: quaternary ammonium compound efflux SMR transporter SugE [bacterium]|nr:quaternary ammonium compound efflux SMR transporter SugE [bacterium]